MQVLAMVHDAPGFSKKGIKPEPECRYSEVFG